MVILFKMLICYTKTVVKQLQNQQIQNTIHKLQQYKEKNVTTTLYHVQPLF